MTETQRDIARSFARKIEQETRPPGDIRGASFDDGHGDAVQIAVALKGQKRSAFWSLDTNLRSLNAAIKRADGYFADGQIQVESIEHPAQERNHGHAGGVTLVHVRIPRR